MRWWNSTSQRALAIGAVVGGVGLAVLGSQHPHLPALPGQTPPALAPAHDLDADLQKQALVQPRSDVEMEDQASRPIQTVVEVARGDTLVELLIRSGVDKAEAVKAVEALSDIYDPRALKVGQEVTVSFDRPRHGIGAGPFNGVTLQPDAARQVSAKRGADGYAASEVKREIIHQRAHFSGTIKGSLFEAAATQGVPASVIAEMIHALSYDVDFQRDIQPGDKFEVLFDRAVDKKGQTVRDGEILFANLILSGEPNPIYRYVDSQGTADYYNVKGESVRKALLRTPVDGAKISSGFGMRMHPILGYTKLHKGVDFAVRSGTPVMAAGSGTIDYAGAFGAYGYYVRIKHDAVHATAYAHLSRFAQGIRVGKHVEQGQTIAYSGATGRATGPHLHYEVLINNSQVNPMSVKFQSGNKLTGRELDRFQSSIHEAETLLVQTPVSSKVALAHSSDGAE
jgi:murein DD-endopeptidase MepM/ murein hydrolase activator NlpD